MHVSKYFMGYFVRKMRVNGNLTIEIARGFEEGEVWHKKTLGGDRLTIKCMINSLTK